MSTYRIVAPVVWVAMTPDEITHRERRGAPEPIQLPQPEPEPVGTPAGS